MTGQEVNTIIDNLSTKLGVTASEILPYYVKYYRWQGIFFVLLGLILIIVSVHSWRRWVREEKREHPYSDLLTVLSLTTYTLFVVGVCFIGFNIVDVCAPQKPAYQELILSIRGKP